MSLLPYIFEIQPSKSVLSWPSLVSFDDDFFKPQRLSNVWEQLTQCHKEITIDKDKFQANIDVQQYKPDEIVVKLTGSNTVTIEGKHEENPEHGYVSRSFVRHFTLPEDCDAQKLQTKISSEGLLVLSVPKKNENELVQISEMSNQNSTNFKGISSERKHTSKKTVSKSSKSSKQAVMENEKQLGGSPNSTVTSSTYVEESVYHETQNGNGPAIISQSTRVENSGLQQMNNSEKIEQSAHHQKQQEVRRMSNSSVVLESSGTASPIIQFPESPDVFAGRNKFVGEFQNVQQSTRQQKRQVRTSSNSSLIIEQVEESVSNKNDRKSKDMPPLPTGRSKITSTEERVIKEERHSSTSPVNVVESTSVTSTEETNCNERRQSQKTNNQSEEVRTRINQDSPVNFGANQTNTTETTIVCEEHQTTGAPITIVESTRTQNIQQTTRQQKQQLRTSSNSSVVIEQTEQSVCNKNNKTDIPTDRSVITTTEEEIIKEEQHRTVPVNTTRNQSKSVSNVEETIYNETRQTKKPTNQPKNDGVAEPTYESAPFDQASPTGDRPTEIVIVTERPEVRQGPVTVIESTQTTSVQQSTRQQKKQVRTSSNSSVVIEQEEETIFNKNNKTPKNTPALPTGKSTITTTEEEIINEQDEINKVQVPVKKPKESNEVEELTYESTPLDQQSPVDAKPDQVVTTEERPQVVEVPVAVIESTNVQQSTRQQKKQVKTSSNSSVVIERVEETVCNKNDKTPKDTPALPTGRSTITTTEEEIIKEQEEINKVQVPVKKPKESNEVEELTYESTPLDQQSPVDAKPDQVVTVEERPQVIEVPIAVIESTNVQQSTRQQKKQVKTSSNSSVVIERVEETVCNKNDKTPKDTPALPTDRSTIITTEEEIIKEQEEINKVQVPVKKPKESNEVEELTYESTPLDQQSPVDAKPDQVVTIEEKPQVVEVPIAVIESTNVQQSTRQQKKQVKTSSNSSVVTERVEETVCNKKNKTPKADTPALPTGKSIITTTEEEIIKEQQQIRNVPIDVVESTSVSSVEETTYNKTNFNQTPINKPAENNEAEEPTYKSAPLNQTSPLSARPHQINPDEDRPQVREVPINVIESTTTQNIQQSTRQQKQQVRTSSNSSVVIEQESVCSQKNRGPKDVPAMPTGRSTIKTTEEKIITEQQHVRNVPINVVQSKKVNSVEESHYTKTQETSNKPSSPQPGLRKTNTKEKTVIEEKREVREVPVTVVESTQTQNVQQSSSRHQKQQVRTSSNSSVIIEQVIPSGRSKVTTNEERIIKEQQYYNDVPVTIVDSTSVRSSEHINQNKKLHNQSERINTAERTLYESIPSNIGSSKIRETVIEERHHQSHHVQDVPIGVVKTQNFQQSSHHQQHQQVRRNSNSSLLRQNVEENLYSNQQVRNVPAGLTGVTKISSTTEYVVRENPTTFINSTSVNNVKEVNQNQRQQFTKSSNFRTTEESSKINQQQSTRNKNVDHQQHTKKGFNNQSTMTRNVEESHQNQSQTRNGINGETITKKSEESRYQHNEQVRSVPMSTFGVSSQNVQQVNEHYQSSNTTVRSSQQGGHVEKTSNKKYYAPGLIDIKFE